MKIIEGFFARAISNRDFTSLKIELVSTESDWLNRLTHLSLSPCHLDTRSELETEMKVELLASVATALARKLLPVPGGPYRRIPFQGDRPPT